MTQVDVFQTRVRHYAGILDPLFDATAINTQDELFELVCVLVRCSGIQSADWDPLHESEATLNDLKNLAALELPTEQFANPTEMDFPYVLLANLLRLRIGAKYDINPFGDMVIPVRRKKNGLVLEAREPLPGRKIVRIKELAEKAKLPNIGSALEHIYDNKIRNSVYHSDYTLSDNEFRMLGGGRLSAKKRYISQIVDWELNTLFTECFAFYTALFALYSRCRMSFGDFVDAIVPYDGHYKALLQLVFDDEKLLIGFRTYWPDGTIGSYSRTKKGNAAVNLRFDPDGSVNFMVGLYATRPSTFSPLVEVGYESLYSEIPGTNIRPHWPSDLRPYKVVISG